MTHPAARSPVTLFICRTCGYKQVKNPDGTPADNPTSVELVQAVKTQLRAHHPAEADHITVRLSTCLSVCNDGIAWGLRADDRFAYVFAHAPLGGASLPANNGAADLAQAALAYLATRPGGKIPKSELPESIRPHTVSKLPPVG